MATFGLIHGAWHGAWCWERLAIELERLGHAARAMDLRIDDPDADMLDWAGAVCAAVEDAADPLILVGHSLGGALLPLVAARRSVARAVYLAAILHPALLPPGAPGPHAPGTFARLQRFPDRSHRWPSASAVGEVLYSGCSPEDVRWAFARLRRQQTARPWADVPVPDPWPTTPISSIVCTQDRTIRPRWASWAARRVLGVEPIELRSDHSPFLSCPGALATILDRIADADARRPASPP